MLRHHGEPPRFDFAPLSHEAIGERLGLTWVKEQIESLHDRTYADSMSEVIRRALATYHFQVAEIPFCGMLRNRFHA